MTNNIIVYSENLDLSLQLAGKAREMGSAIAITHEADQAIALAKNCSKVYKSQEVSLETIKMALVQTAQKESSNLILIGSTKRGKELAPRVAAAMDSGYSSDCFDIKFTNAGLEVKKFTYGGSIVSTEVIKGSPAIVTIPARTFQKPGEIDSNGVIVELAGTVKSKVRVIECKPKRTEDAGLDGAKVIVSAGRGFKKSEDLKLMEALADELGAKMGCTRPIAADLGWMSQWVGISGKKVTPKLYVACGISGTIQHAAGIRDSQIIVSINNDEAAGIHEISDYSIVGDLYTVLPALVKALKERG